MLHSSQNVTNVDHFHHHQLHYSGCCYHNHQDLTIIAFIATVSTTTKPVKGVRNALKGGGRVKLEIGDDKKMGKERV